MLLERAAGKTLNPYQGLKRRFMYCDRDFRFYAGKTLNPYQGLKLDKIKNPEWQWI